MNPERRARWKESFQVWLLGSSAVLAILVGGTAVRMWHWLVGKPEAQEMAAHWRAMTANPTDDRMTERRKRPVSSIRRALDRYGRR